MNNLHSKGNIIAHRNGKILQKNVYLTKTLKCAIL